MRQEKVTILLALFFFILLLVQLSFYSSRRAQFTVKLPDLRSSPSPTTTPVPRSPTPTRSHTRTASTSPIPPLDTLVYLRIPKASEVAVDTLLRRMLPRGSCTGFGVSVAADNADCINYAPCNYYLTQQLKKEECHVILGHYCDFRDLFQNTAGWSMERTQVGTVTWLRDPVDRVISEWKHVHGDYAWDYCISPVAGATTREDFLQFLEDPAHKLGMRNRQTRMLAGCGEQDCSRVYKSNQDMLKAAKEHLQQFDAFGITERPHESIELLSRAFPNMLKDSTFADHGDPVHERKDWQYDEDVRQQILSFNHLDNQLLQFANALMDQRLRDVLKKK